MKTTLPTADGKKLTDRDELYESAIDIVVREGRGSVSLLQRSLGIGYGRAARLIDFMAEDGIVGPYNGSQAREILMSLEQWQQMTGEAAEAESVESKPRRNTKIRMDDSAADSSADRLPGTIKDDSSADRLPGTIKTVKPTADMDMDGNMDDMTPPWEEDEEQDTEDDRDAEDNRDAEDRKYDDEQTDEEELDENEDEDDDTDDDADDDADETEEDVAEEDWEEEEEDGDADDNEDREEDEDGEQEEQEEAEKAEQEDSTDAASEGADDKGRPIVSHPPKRRWKAESA